MLISPAPANPLSNPRRITRVRLADPRWADAFRIIALGCHLWQSVVVEVAEASEGVDEQARTCGGRGGSRGTCQSAGKAPHVVWGWTWQ
eukprot:6181288-Pleurochrysis_carterae.AAC.2